MEQGVSLRHIRNAYEEAIGSALNLYASVEPFVARYFEGIAPNPLHPSPARRIVSLGFLAIVASWEEFIEGTFVRYLCGASSTGQRRPQLRFGPPWELDAGFSVLAGRVGFNPIRDC